MGLEAYQAGGGYSSSTAQAASLLQLSRFSCCQTILNPRLEVASGSLQKRSENWPQREWLWIEYHCQMLITLSGMVFGWL
jgi:hypothetical protein